jgi:hypothetical protein
VTVDASIDRGFLLAEEEALKAKLTKIYVSDPNAPAKKRRVHVRWGYPMAEVNRQYPFISIDLIDIEFAADRAHSAQIVPIDYWPSEYATFAEYAEAYGLTLDDVHLVQATMWHPYDLHFQLATHARSARHDLELTNILLTTNFLPHRWGWLFVPADQSYRWLDLVDWATANYNEGAGDSQNRIYRKIYHIVVSAHLPPEDPFIFAKVLKVHGTLKTIPGEEVMGEWDHEAPSP